MYAQTVLTALIAWPAIAAVAVLAAPARWAKHLALAGSLLEFAISEPLWWVFQPAVGMQLQLDARAGVLRAPAGAHLRDDRRIRGARSVPVLRHVGRDAPPDVFHHRGVGWTEPLVR